MTFYLKKFNTAGLSYKNDNQIRKANISEGKIISLRNIEFTKSYKIKIRASKMLSGKIIVRKKTIIFPKTMKIINAIAESSNIYKQLMNEIKDNFYSTNLLFPSMTFKEVFNLYLKDKQNEYEHKNNKKSFEKRGIEQFSEKWLKSIHNMKMNEIFRQHINLIKINMKDKKGNQLADRTKLTVNQTINPVYTFFNTNSNYVLKSPALILPIDRIPKSVRKFDLSINEIKELFFRLSNYNDPQIKEVFIWLMHGRRRNEVLQLKWEDIDFLNKTYTIRAINNKARIDMKYRLSKYLELSLINIGKQDKGFIFKDQKNTSTSLRESIIRKHWNKLNEKIVLHQIRNCIVHYLKNVHGISNELAGFIIGHTQTKSVTEIYGIYGYDKLNDTLNLMLDDIFKS